MAQTAELRDEFNNVAEWWVVNVGSQFTSWKDFGIPHGKSLVGQFAEFQILEDLNHVWLECKYDNGDIWHIDSSLYHLKISHSPAAQAWMVSRSPMDITVGWRWTIARWSAVWDLCLGEPGEQQTKCSLTGRWPVHSQCWPSQFATCLIWKKHFAGCFSKFQSTPSRLEMILSILVNLHPFPT